MRKLFFLLVFSLFMQTTFALVSQCSLYADMPFQNTEESADHQAGHDCCVEYDIADAGSNAALDSMNAHDCDCSEMVSVHTAFDYPALISAAYPDKLEQVVLDLYETTKRMLLRPPIFI